MGALEPSCCAPEHDAAATADTSNCNTPLGVLLPLPAVTTAVMFSRLVRGDGGGDRQERKGEGDEGAYLPSPERLDGSPPLRIRALVLELLVDRHPHNLFLCKESAHLSTPSATPKSTQRLVYPALFRRPRSAQQGWTRQILAARISLAGGTGDNLLPAHEHSQRQHLSISPSDTTSSLVGEAFSGFRPKSMQTMGAGMFVLVSHPRALGADLSSALSNYPPLKPSVKRQSRHSNTPISEIEF